MYGLVEVAWEPVRTEVKPKKEAIEILKNKKYAKALFINWWFSKALYRPSIKIDASKGDTIFIKISRVLLEKLWFGSVDIDWRTPYPKKRKPNRKRVSWDFFLIMKKKN